MAFGQSDVMGPEQQLSIQIGDIDRIQIDHRYVGKATEHQVLNQFTTNTTGSD